MLKITCKYYKRAINFFKLLNQMTCSEIKIFNKLEKKERVMIKKPSLKLIILKINPLLAVF